MNTPGLVKSAGALTALAICSACGGAAVTPLSVPFTSTKSATGHKPWEPLPKL
jgi:hypothetical protein